MKKILIVEDSTMVIKVLKHVFNSSPHFNPLYAMTYAQAKQIVEDESDIFAALVDLNLPDAENGEVVDFVLAKNIPAIVLTGSFDEQKRSELISKGVVDYVTKEGRYSYEYAHNVLLRLVKNRSLKVLVVDDSSTARKHIKALLQLQMFNVQEASDGVQAIKILLENQDIRLVITDYNMPRMDGCEMVKHIRVKYEKTDLIIIGLSSEGEGTLSARFIKTGANDFLRKPFNHEEFYCRINHNIEFLEMVEAIRDASYRDDLTGVYNRKYFFEQGQEIYSSAKDNQQTLTLAMMELDHFNTINQDFGTELGDSVIKSLATQLNGVFERFLFARAEDTGFYVLMAGLDIEKAKEVIGVVRQKLDEMDIVEQHNALEVTLSVGVSGALGECFDDLCNAAAKQLRRAKDAGGDLVFSD